MKKDKGKKGETGGHQVRGHGDLEDDEKQLDSRCILKVELTA